MATAKSEEKGWDKYIEELMEYEEGRWDDQGNQIIKDEMATVTVSLEFYGRWDKLFAEVERKVEEFGKRMEEVCEESTRKWEERFVEQTKRLPEEILERGREENKGREEKVEETLSVEEKEGYYEEEDYYVDEEDYEDKEYYEDEDKELGKVDQDVKKTETIGIDVKESFHGKEDEESRKVEELGEIDQEVKEEEILRVDVKKKSYGKEEEASGKVEEVTIKDGDGDMRSVGKKEIIGKNAKEGYYEVEEEAMGEVMHGKRLREAKGLRVSGGNPVERGYVTTTPPEKVWKRRKKLCEKRSGE